MNAFPITILLMVANVVYSYLGFTRPGLMDKHGFHVEPVLRHKEYLRLVTSGFLHVNWFHLIMNMLSLYYMGRVLEVYYVVQYAELGYLVYLLLYFGSMLGGKALALLMHHKHGNYRSVGASGAISGVIFALVILMPDSSIIFFFIPMTFWLYAVIYVGFSLFGMRTGFMNIGHEAHLGGALVGLLLGCLFAMDAAKENWVLVLCLTLPTVALIYLFYHNPTLGIDPIAALKNLNFGNKRRTSTRTNVNTRTTPVPEKRVKQDGLEINMKAKLQAEMDALLEKVSRKGMSSLSTSERKRLDELANYFNRSNNPPPGGRAPRD